MLRYFPAAGIRDYQTGDPSDRGRLGRYWSSSTDTASRGGWLSMGPVESSVGSWYRSTGATVRCVALWKFSNYMLLLLFFVFNCQLSIFHCQLNCCVAQSLVTTCCF